MTLAGVNEYLRKYGENVGRDEAFRCKVVVLDIAGVARGATRPTFGAAQTGGPTAGGSSSSSSTWPVTR